MKILAVDDDPIILDLIQNALSQESLNEITLCPSGPEALKLLTSGAPKFDCLLLDIEMPEMDGISLCHQVRALEGYHHTPILMLTQRTDASSIEKAFSAGATDYVTKPFEARNLYARLKVAERMMARSETAPRMNVRQLSKKSLPGQHQFTLDDPLYIESIPQLILPFQLGTYLSQLSRKHLSICHVFAVAIDDFKSLYDDHSTREVAIALIATASAITQTIQRSQLLMTYNGCGMFLCVVTSKRSIEWPAMEISLQKHLDEMKLCYDNRDAMKLVLKTGKPIQPNASATQRVRRTFDRAIQRVSSRPEPNLVSVSAAQ